MEGIWAASCTEFRRASFWRGVAPSEGPSKNHFFMSTCQTSVFVCRLVIGKSWFRLRNKSPWLDMSSYVVTKLRTASQKLFRYLLGLRNPIKKSKMQKITGNPEIWILVWAWAYMPLVLISVGITHCGHASPHSTRAGGQDDVSLKKLPQKIFLIFRWPLMGALMETHIYHFHRLYK